VRAVDLLVVGCGLAGLNTALALTTAGLDCAVVEGEAPSERDDPADCGLTAFRAPWSMPAEVEQLAGRSRILLPDLIARLGQATGVDCEHRRIGLVLGGEVPSVGMAWLAATRQPWRQGRLVDFEPALAWGQSPAVRLTAVDQVRPSRLIRALYLSLRQRGVPILTGQPVRRLDITGNVIRAAVLDNGKTIRADAIILAADQASSRLLHASGLDPLDEAPVTVPHLRLNCGHSRIQHAARVGEIALVPRPDGRLLASLAGPAPGESGMPPFDRLLTSVGNWLPSVNRFDVEAHWVGPPLGGTARNPCIGAYPWIRGLWINAGHHLAGPIVAPAAAELIVDQLNGGPAAPGLAVRTRPFHSSRSAIVTEC